MTTREHISKHMSFIDLSVDQEDALNRMKIGCILNGGVGSGKSRTGIAFYYKTCGGDINTPRESKMTKPRDLYIITTARKRDTMEWERELSWFTLYPFDKVNKKYGIKIVIDSWNNIQKYVGVKDAFFIFDEQRVVGYGVWTKSFLKIASQNRWILLSATPGDTWMDYIPVFIANGFFRNKTDFIKRHVVYSRFTKYPKIDKYINEARLIKFRNHITVNMNFKRETVAHKEYVISDYDKKSYDWVVRNRFDVYKDKPIENAGEYCLVLRRIVNSSPDKQLKLLDILERHKKVIVFYVYDFELDILRDLFKNTVYKFAEWNGHKHEPIPDTDKWVYLVQYTAGAEGWNCITTDTIVFFSLSYSYKQMVQAAGRIDRRNTPFKDLYYYYLKTSSKIDSAIFNTLKHKKQFTERGFAPDFSKKLEQSSTENKTPKQPSIFDELDNQINSTSDKNKIKPIEEYCEEYCNWLDPNSPMYDPTIEKKEKL